MMVSRRQFVTRAAAGAVAASLPIYVYAEPVTLAIAAAYVGEKLLAGALEHVGGRLMAQALGEADISDVRDWIQEAVAELEQFVSAEMKRQLDAKILESMDAKLESVNRLLHEYAGLKESHRKENKQLIEHSNEATAELLPLSFNYDQALFITTAAMGYSLYCVYGLYQLDRDSSHIKSARPTMDKFVTTSTATRDRISAKLDPKNYVSGKCDIYAHERGGAVKFCRIFKEGQFVERMYKPLGRDAATAEKELDQQYKAALQRYSAPYLKAQNDFLEVVNASISNAILCYQAMCRQIKETYSPPPPFDVVQSATAAGNPKALRTITMPGAVVKNVAL